MFLDSDAFRVAETSTVHGRNGKKLQQRPGARAAAAEEVVGGQGERWREVALFIYGSRSLAAIVGAEG